jgi:hypothetical protein
MWTAYEQEGSGPEDPRPQGEHEGADDEESRSESRPGDGGNERDPFVN